MENETQETPVEVPAETPPEPVPVETAETEVVIESDPVESTGTPTEGVPGSEELPQILDPFANLVPENPQLYSTSYTTDDYIITLVHDITLGDILISTLLSVLIIVQVLKAMLGGGRRW